MDLLLAIKEVLNEMAFSRDRTEDKVSGVANEINTHICKVLADPNNENVNHWLNEIYGFLLPISTMKLKNNKPIPEKDISKWLFDEIISDESDFRSIIDSMIYIYNMNTRYSNSMYKEYLDIKSKLAKRLSSGKALNVIEVYNLMKGR